jgi:hypothetical protein
MVRLAPVREALRWASEARGRVADEERAQPLARARLAQEPAHLVGELDHLLALS